MHCMHCAHQCIHKWCKIDAGKQRSQAYAIKKTLGKVIATFQILF